MEIYMQKFGSRLRVRDGIFEMTVPDLSGLNRDINEAIPAHEVGSLFLQPGTSVSTDALLLGLEKGTDITVLDKFGVPKGRIQSFEPPRTLDILKQQVIASDTVRGLGYAHRWIVSKVTEQLAHLNDLKKYRSDAKIAVISSAEQEMKTLLARLQHLPLADQDLDRTKAIIRGLEGKISTHYFATLNALIPPEYQFGDKDQHPTKDLFFAFLFYGYGILYRMVEKALVLAGLHPHIGFFHADEYKRKSLVFDFIEPYRTYVNRMVFKIFTDKSVSKQWAEPHPIYGLSLSESARRALRSAFEAVLAQQQRTTQRRDFPLALFIQEQAAEFARDLRDYR